MKEIKEILNQNWIGTAVGVIGIIIGAILAYSFKPRSRLAAQTNTLELVGPNAVMPDELEFFFRGARVPKVSLSRIAIWNIGNTTIRGDQIVDSDPLRIMISEGSTILDSSILNRTRPANAVSCVTRTDLGNGIECRFDYLDPGDGVLIQLIHTGTENVQVTGALRGIPKGVLRVKTPRKQTPPKQDQLSPFAMRLVGLVFLLPGLAMLVVTIMGKVNPPTDWPPFVFAGSILTALGFLFFFGVRYIPPYPLGTQITSNEPKRPFWRIWRK